MDGGPTEKRAQKRENIYDERSSQVIGSKPMCETKENRTSIELRFSSYYLILHKLQQGKTSKSFAIPR